MKNEKDNEEKDLETLRREYRNMEVNRKTLAEESNSVSFAERVTTGGILKCSIYAYIDSFIFCSHSSPQLDFEKAAAESWQASCWKWKPQDRCSNTSGKNDNETTQFFWTEPAR